MSKIFHNENRLMRSDKEHARRELAENIRLTRRQQEAIKDAIENLEEDADIAKAKRSVIKAFMQELSDEEQLKFFERYHNDVRETTTVKYLHVGTVKKRNGKKVFLYEQIVEGATRPLTAKERRNAKRLQNKGQDNRKV